MAISLDALRDAKNSAIGNPHAKLALAAQPAFLSSLTAALALPDAGAEAAHVLAALAQQVLDRAQLTAARQIGRVELVEMVGDEVPVAFSACG